MKPFCSAVLACLCLILLSACSSQGKSAPTIKTMNTQPTSDPGNIVKFFLSGENFGPDANVVVTGHGCETGCSIPDGAVRTKTTTLLVGLADLPPGEYAVTVKNGSGPASGPFPFTVASRNNSPK